MMPAFYSCASAIVLTDKTDFDPVIIFIDRNYKQISQKAAKYGIDVEDAIQSVCVIFLEKLSKYDSTQGTLEGYVFGYFEKLLKRQCVNPIHFSVSLDEAKDELYFFHYGIQQASTVDEDDLETLLSTSMVPGSEGLMEVADLVSGKSAIQLADKYGISKRRINQKLKSLRDGSKVQFDLPFRRRKND